MELESLRCRRPIKLYPQPPFSPQAHREPASDESDFPSIRIRRNVDSSSPGPIHEQGMLKSDESDFPPIRILRNVDSSSPIHDVDHARLPNKRLRCNAALATAQQFKFKLALKRKRSGSPQDGAGQSSSKRKRITFNKDDMDWLKDELRDIKFELGEIRTCIKEIAEHLQGDVDTKLEDIIGRIEQL